MNKNQEYQKKWNQNQVEDFFAYKLKEDLKDDQMENYENMLNINDY